MAVKLKIYNAAAFKEVETPTEFLSGFFPSGPDDKFAGEIVKIDTVRGKEEYAIDVTPYSGGRGNKATTFTTKEYTPPAYNEFGYLTAQELGTVQPGKTEYDLMTDMANLLTSRQVVFRNKIIRAREVLCRDALILGKITLINGDIIDFKQKAQLQYSTPADWTNTSTDALSDFVVVGGRVRKYGVKGIKDAIFGEIALQKFLNNAAVKSQADIKRYDRDAITSPIAAQEGSEYHGTFSAGSYQINIWSYPEQVGIPVGFGLPNEGTKQPYIPDDKIIVLANAPDFRLFYAANPTFASASEEFRAMTGLGEMPGLERGEMQPYFIKDEEEVSIKVGVRSRPIPVPVGIDQFAIITVT